MTQRYAIRARVPRRHAHLGIRGAQINTGLERQLGATLHLCLRLPFIERFLRRGHVNGQVFVTVAAWDGGGGKQ